MKFSISKTTSLRCSSISALFLVVIPLSTWDGGSLGLWDGAMTVNARPERQPMARGGRRRPWRFTPSGMAGGLDVAMGFSILVIFFCLSNVCSRLDAFMALDEKLVPLSGEDETRIVKLFQRFTDPETRRIDFQSITPSMIRSFFRRWQRAGNNSVKNIQRAIAGKRVDGCPRLTRARRRVSRCTPRARKNASAQKRAWRQDPSVKRRENSGKKRWRDANPGKDKAQRDGWRHANPDKVKERRRLEHDINYHRPFIAIDFEGMNYPGNDIDHDGVCYPDHGLFLGGASGEHRDKNGVWCEKPIEWLGYNDKRMLRGEGILEWLLSLPDKYGNATFVMFGMSYDATQILKALGDFLSKKWHFKKVYEICKREKHGTKRSVKGSVYVGNYSINYIIPFP
jgi:hypothetical protein